MPSLSTFRLAFAGGAFLLILNPVTATGTVISFDLMCVLTYKESCEPGPSLGTVTLTDKAQDSVQIDVELDKPDRKFVNMTFQLIGIANAGWNVMDQVQIDVPAKSQKHRAEPITATANAEDSIGSTDYRGFIQADGLSTANFTRSSVNIGQPYVALYIKGIAAPILQELPAAQDEVAHAPEPFTCGVVGASLIALLLAAKRSARIVEESDRVR